MPSSPAHSLRAKVRDDIHETDSSGRPRCRRDAGTRRLLLLSDLLRSHGLRWVQFGLLRLRSGRLWRLRLWRVRILRRLQPVL